MDYSEIRTVASSMSTRTDLLVLLNRIKEDELGDAAFAFTMKQLNYFCNPNKCHSRYKTFTIPKKSGALREISAPTTILKSMLTYANRIFQAFYVPAEGVTGFVPGRSVVDNAMRHVGRNYVLNLDMKDFFPSIHQARVWAVLQLPPFNFNKEIASSLAGLCCMRVHESGTGRSSRYSYVLPQGSPASPILTNIVCQKLDRRLNGLAKRFNVRYSRYADDITFSSDHNVYSEDGEFMTELRRIIADQNFTINEEKTRLQKRGSRQEVTGLVVGEKVNVVRKYTRSLGSLLYIWERYGYKEANKSFLRHYSGRSGAAPSMENVIQGKLMYLKMVKGETDSVFRKLQSRFDVLMESLDRSRNRKTRVLHSMKIDAFEQNSGVTVNFNMVPSKNGKGEHCMASIVDADGNAVDSYVTLTDACASKVAAALAGGDSAAVADLKTKFYISRCESPDGNQYWRIMKCDASVFEKKERTETDSQVSEILDALSAAMEDDGGEVTVVRRFSLDSSEASGDDTAVQVSQDILDAMSAEECEELFENRDEVFRLLQDLDDSATGDGVRKDNQPLTTEDALDKLLSSGFDLEILEKWDTKKKS